MKRGFVKDNIYSPGEGRGKEKLSLKTRLNLTTKKGEGFAGEN